MLVFWYFEVGSGVIKEDVFVVCLYYIFYGGKWIGVIVYYYLFGVDIGIDVIVENDRNIVV